MSHNVGGRGWGCIILEMFSNDLFHPVQLSKTRTYLIYNDIKQICSKSKSCVCSRYLASVFDKSIQAAGFPTTNFKMSTLVSKIQMQTFDPD